jgi:hypothetical protein
MTSNEQFVIKEIVTNLERIKLNEKGLQSQEQYAIMTTLKLLKKLLANAAIGVLLAFQCAAAPPIMPRIAHKVVRHVKKHKKLYLSAAGNFWSTYRVTRKLAGK